MASSIHSIRLLPSIGITLAPIDLRFWTRIRTVNLLSTALDYDDTARCPPTQQQSVLKACTGYPVPAAIPAKLVTDTGYVCKQHDTRLLLVITVDMKPICALLFSYSAPELQVCSKKLLPLLLLAYFSTSKLLSNNKTR